MSIMIHRCSFNGEFMSISCPEKLQNISAASNAQEGVLDLISNQTKFVDADTCSAINPITVDSVFIGKTTLPDPRNLRYDIFSHFSCNQEQNLQKAFILHNSCKLKLLDDCSLQKRRAEPLFATYLNSAEGHYFCRINLALSLEWQSLPSVSADEELLHFYIDSEVDVEVTKSSQTDLYYIRLKNSQLNAPQHVTCEMILFHQLSCPLYSDLPESVRQLAHNCRGFRNEELKNIQPNIPPQELLDTIIRERAGSGSHRSIVFKHLMHEKHSEIPVRLVSNHVHMFVEVEYEGRWVACDLGGYPLFMKVNNMLEEDKEETNISVLDQVNKMLDPYKKEPKNLSKLKEVYEITISDSFLAIIKDNFFDELRNLATLTLKDCTLSSCIYDLSTIDTLHIISCDLIEWSVSKWAFAAPNLKTLIIEDCTIDPEYFNNLSFARWVKLEYVKFIGGTISDISSVMQLMATAPKARCIIESETFCVDEHPTILASNIEMRTRRLEQCHAWSSAILNLQHTSTKLQPSMKVHITPLKQLGSLCKSVVIANVEKYYAETIGYDCMPLLSEKKLQISIRKIVKVNGSCQGEILEFAQWRRTLECLGFSSEEINFYRDIVLFVASIILSLEQGHLPLIVFPVDSSGLPTVNIYNSLHAEKCEHAAVIVGYNLQKETVSIVHWGQEYEVDLTLLFNSTHKLVDTRHQELYSKNTEYLPEKKDSIIKYIPFNNQLCSEISRMSISPQKGSGFKTKLLIIKKPNKEFLLRKRDEMLHNDSILSMLSKYSLFSVTSQSNEENINILGFVDNSSFEARPPATCSRDPGVLRDTKAHCIQQDRNAPSDQVAERWLMNCQQPVASHSGPIVTIAHSVDNIRENRLDNYADCVIMLLNDVDNITALKCLNTLDEMLNHIIRDPSLKFNAENPLVDYDVFYNALLTFLGQNLEEGVEACAYEIFNKLIDNRWTLSDIESIQDVAADASKNISR